MLALMDWVRLDVSEVRPQGAEIAKRCPVRAQWDELRPADPSPPSERDLRRAEAGRQFEADVVAELVQHHPAAVVVGPGDAEGREGREDRERRTVEAMDAGAALIIGGRLPPDPLARRVGEPDVLVAAQGGGYHPVDVKHHRTLTQHRGVPTRSSTLEMPWASAAVEDAGQLARKSKDDLFQLAHYRRMLQSCGHAATSGSAGVIGTELSVTWYDLDAPIWRTPSLSTGRTTRSTVDVYDFEFAFRLDIIETARRHRDDPAIPLLVVPVRTGECSTCPWWGQCEQLLEATDDVSLVPHSGWRIWSAHRDRDVHTVGDLASLDVRTADLVERGVDLAGLFGDLDGHPDEAPLGQVVRGALQGQLATLADAGIHSVGDALQLDRRLAPYSDSAPRGLAESIDLARARSSDPPVFLRRGISRIDVHRGDVEVDLDLENTEDGVYLWGALVTDRAGSGLVDEGYRSFVSWDPDPSGWEVELAEQLCAWLAGLRTALAGAGHSLAVYCFHERVEAGALRRLTAANGRPGRWSGWVEDLVTSEDWVDLLIVARRHLITGGAMGLKHLAPLAGFSWEDDDPGGEQSMEWHRIATTDADPDVRQQMKERILTYNRNDVEATLALRNWMCSQGASLPRIELLDAPRGR